MYSIKCALLISSYYYIGNFYYTKIIAVYAAEYRCYELNSTSI